jgi:hypothetical protein
MTHDESARFTREIDAAIQLLREREARLPPAWTVVVNRLLELRRVCEAGGNKGDEAKAGILLLARDTLSGALAEASGRGDLVDGAPLVLALASLHQQIVKALDAGR